MCVPCSIQQLELIKRAQNEQTNKKSFLSGHHSFSMCVTLGSPKGKSARGQTHRASDGPELVPRRDFRGVAAALHHHQGGRLASSPGYVCLVQFAVPCTLRCRVVCSPACGVPCAAYWYHAPAGNHRKCMRSPEIISRKTHPKQAGTGAPGSP